jgi:hypothetical protein
MRGNILIIAFYCLIQYCVSGQTQQKYPGFSKPVGTDNALDRLPDYVMPVIGAWFWSENEFKPSGYKSFIDNVKIHSPYNILATSVRGHGREANKGEVHDQVKSAAEYADKCGIKMALDMDVRLARRAFEARYPDELQELLRLKEVKLPAADTVKISVYSVDLTDHMTGSTEHYIPVKGSLIRVYSYDKTSEGIDPVTLKDITARCLVRSSSKDSVVVCVPLMRKAGQTFVCAMVSFTHLTPDVFAPHLIEFQREIIHSYADVPLAGGMKDEWGFPPCREHLEDKFLHLKFPLAQSNVQFREYHLLFLIRI